MKAPSKREKEALKQVIRNIVVGQGNRFIKELLRDNHLPIGATKADFLDNLMQAIDSNALTSDMIASWLSEVEGWGNQHVYLYKRPKIHPSSVEKRIKNSPLKDLLSPTASYDFPDKLKLTSITVNSELVSLNWHRGNDRWIYVPGKNYREEEEGDIYEYRAFRQRSYRTVMRFEWQFAKPYCSVFMQLPHEGTTHQDGLGEVWKALKEIDLYSEDPQRVTLSKSVNSFSTDTNEITSGRTMHAEGGYVDFVCTIPDHGIADVEGLRAVSGAIDERQFSSADGKFRLETERHEDLSRDVNVSIYGGESRIRIAVQCRREDVYYIIDLIWQKN